MDIDERHCPNCGHGTLDWSVVCPGCDTVPWESDAGWKVVRKRRFQQWLPVGGPLALLLVASLGLVVFGNVTFLQGSRAIEKTKAIEAKMVEAQSLQRMLAAIKIAGHPRSDDSMRLVHEWLDENIPHLINVVANKKESEIARAAALSVLGEILDSRSPLAQLTAEYRMQVEQISEQLLEHSNEYLRDASLTVLKRIEAEKYPSTNLKHLSL